jgi:aminocarboxymuconate-semialdehyde decarboxylase
MSNRRAFLKTVAGATAGVLAGGRGLLDAAVSPQNTPARREVMVGGHRAKVVDIHAHCVIPEVEQAISDTMFASMFNPPPKGPLVLGPQRVRTLDERGIDVQVLSINGFWWYQSDREHAEKVVQVQNRGLAKWCDAHPDRFAALTSVALQFPDLAAQQLEHAMKQQGMRGACIGGDVMGETLSSPKYDPFWAKAEELGALVFMHPTNAQYLGLDDALKGRGDLGNILGDPLETALFLAHMIYDGTLDRFPGLKICAAHGGGYLPSYLGRFEVACKVRPLAKCANKKPPSEYLKSQIFVDSVILSEEGMRHLAAVVGSGQMVYGTDIPFNWPDSQNLILNASFLTDAQKEQILGANAAKLLRL